MFVADRGGIRFDRLRGNDADDAKRPRGIKELRVAGAANLLVLIAEEEDGPALSRSCRKLRASVDGLEETFLDEEVDDACGSLEALPRDVDDEHASVENVREVRLIAGVGAEGIFELRIGEACECGLDRAVDTAAFFFAVLRRDGRFVVDRAFKPARIEARVAIAVGGADLELEQRVAGGRDRRLAAALIEDVIVESLERVGARNVEEDGQCGLRARDGQREPECRVTFALPQKFEGRFEEPGRSVGREAVERFSPSWPTPMRWIALPVSCAACAAVV